mgnify:CR=1 FL=1
MKPRRGFIRLPLSQCVNKELHEIVTLLQEYNKERKKRCVLFRGVWLYSDTVTIDSAYLAVTGLTKEQIDANIDSFFGDYI